MDLWWTRPNILDMDLIHVDVVVVEVRKIWNMECYEGGRIRELPQWRNMPDEQDEEVNLTIFSWSQILITVYFSSDYIF